LNELLAFIGCELKKTTNDIDHERFYGFRVKESNENVTVELIVPDSPASFILVESDSITHIDNQPIHDDNFSDLTKGKEEMNLQVTRNYRTQTLVLKKCKTDWLPTYSIRKKENATEIEKQNFKSWIHQEF